MKKIALIMVCLILLFCCTGCQDAAEVDSWAYAYFIGIDKGVTDELRFSIVVPTMKEGNGSGSGGGQTGMEQQQTGNTTVISIDCSTLYDGLDMINTFLSRRVNYMHCKFLVISEDLAIQGVAPFLQGMRYARQVRLNMHMIVVKGQASEFIKEFNPAVGTSIPKTQEGIMAASDYTALIDHETYLDVLRDLKSSKKQASCTLASINDFTNYLPAGTGSDDKNKLKEYYPGDIPRTGGSKTEFLGTAVFAGDKMVGELNANETRALTMIKGTMTNTTITIKDPLDEKNYVSISVQKLKNREINITLSGDKPVIHVKVYLEGNILNQHSEVEYQNQNLQQVLERAFEGYIKGKIDTTIKKCQELNCDIFGFGEVASMQFWTIQKWEKYNWLRKFKDAQVHTEVKVNIEGTGLTIENNPVKEDNN